MEEGCGGFRAMNCDNDEECFHEEYEADINGRASCNRCGYRWWLTSAEIERERQLHVEYDRMVRRWERERFWQEIKHRLGRLIFWRRRRPSDGLGGSCRRLWRPSITSSHPRPRPLHRRPQGGR